SSNIPANQTGGPMTADRTKTGPESGEAQLGSAGPSRPPAADKADSRAEDPFSQSMADLSRRLGERAARQPAGAPGEAKGVRRVKPWHQRRHRRRQAALAPGPPCRPGRNRPRRRSANRQLASRRPTRPGYGATK